MRSRKSVSPAAPSAPANATPANNADVADQLLRMAQLLSTKGENPFKVRAYRRAAESIRTLPESIHELVREDADLTQIAGIGKGLSGAIRELVQSGALRQLDTLRAEVAPEVAAISEYPRLDPKRVLRIYKKLGISTVAELRAALESGELQEKLGARMAQHVRQATTDATEILLYDADELVPGILTYLKTKCGVKRAEPAGEYRRRVEVVRELVILVEAPDFNETVEAFQRYAGRTTLVESAGSRAAFKLSSGLQISLQRGDKTSWGFALLLATGSDGHIEELDTPMGRLKKMASAGTALSTEKAVYEALGSAFVEPELREGLGEVKLAKGKALPKLISLTDLRGELHAHSTSSDGAQSIEAMAEAAREKGYEYFGITDHSQSLKIAGGVSEEDLWKQIRHIDKLNKRLRGIQILKSAEVDILVDGSLDYPDELLAELDYTVCSIHSKFSLPKDQQTERILRAMDNPYFNLLGHATGRLLLRRPGYEIDVERVIEHARQNGCFFEINSSPDRLDLSAENARLAREAGVRIAINTDAHSRSELDFIRCGIDVARRAGLSKKDVLNTESWSALSKALRRK